ncbi:hypothetical protein GCM10027060_13290 [Nesterenkonia halophila]
MPSHHEPRPDHADAPTTQARGRERRTALLRAAVELMLSAGTSSVTHRQVASAAGASLGSVRYYFSTREELLLAGVDHLEAEREASAKEALATAQRRAGEDGEVPAERAAELFVEAFYGPDLADAVLVGYVGIVLDCARDSEALSLRMREHRAAMDAQLRELLDACGMTHATVSLTTAVVDGSLLNAAALRGEQLAATAAAELAPLLRTPAA